ncbi:MAG: FkbM family methyltransferase [Cyanobacteria bacterium J06592_8]
MIEQLIESDHLVFDVGANVGGWTKEVLERKQNLEVHLFEPIPNNYTSLIKSLTQAIETKTVIPNNYALGQEDSLRTFYFYKDRPRWSTAYRRFKVEKQYKLENPQEIPVLVTTLDRYCNTLGIQRINFLKIDVEGSELEVIQGAEEFLRKGKIDYIQFEYGGNYIDAKITLEAVFSLFNKYRYSIFKIQPSQLEHIPNFSSKYENFKYSNFLAVNERLVSKVLGKKPQMLDVQKLCQEYTITPRGIIHIGAHQAKGLDQYQKVNATQVLLIEANPTIFESLKEKVAGLENVQAIHCAISNQDGTANLHITSLDQASSILPLKKVEKIYKNIKETHQITVQSKKLDTLLEEQKLKSSDFNILNIDIQGAELLAFQGAENLLKHIEAINTEVNYEELYEGCALIDQLDDFLEQYGFERVATTSPYHPTWGDAFYVKKPVVTMSTLGAKVRFANNLFRYAFLKIYAKEHNFRVETSNWIGQYIFDHNDPAILNKLPQVREQAMPYKLSESKILNSQKPFKNVDFFGFFQFHTSYYAAHKDYFRSLFLPIPEIESKLKKALQNLRSKGKTIVGLHLRRGDYKHAPRPYLSVAPNIWYREWLKGFWDTLEQPVLFIASDEIKNVIGDFSDYNPITVQDLNIELSQANYYPDFYILSQCDVLAISNSSFSFAAAMLNERAKLFVRPHLPQKKLIPFDPWNSEPILRWSEAEFGDQASNQVEEVKVEILAVKLSTGYSHLLLGRGLGSPKSGDQTNTSKIKLEGWVLGKKSPAVAVEIIHDGKSIQRISINQSRLDVARRYPQSLEVNQCGFKGEFDVSQLPVESEIFIQAVLKDRSHFLIAKVKLKWQDLSSSSLRTRDKFQQDLKQQQIRLQKFKAQLDNLSLPTQKLQIQETSVEVQPGQEDVPWFVMSAALARGESYSLPTETETEKALIAGVSIVKDEQDIIYYNLEWQYRQGIKRFVILENQSSDHTAEEIRRFADTHPEATVYLIEDRDPSFQKYRKLTAAAELAHRIWGVEWIFPFDGDELLCSGNKALPTLLKSVKEEQNCIRLEYRNYIPISFYDQSETNPIKRMTHRLKNTSGQGNKVLVRWKPGMVIGQGQHIVCLNGKGVPYIYGKPLGLFIRHYPFRSKEQIRQKIIKGGQAYAATQGLPERVGRTWKEWYIQYQLRGEEYIDEFYNSQLSGHEDAVYDPAFK